VSRIVAAAIEQCHDAKGIVWPDPIAPMQVALLNLRVGDAACTAAAEALYQTLQSQGVRVLLDDRDTQAGEKFAEADLLGFPWQALVGPKSVAAGVVEWKRRATGEVQTLPVGQLPW
jgi:prolyl-tRNA synthetase